MSKHALFQAADDEVGFANQTEEDNAPRYPLGLPAGSVRALLALLIVAVVVVEMLRGHNLDLLWSETLMIVLAHYFATRRKLRIPPDILRQLQEENEFSTEPHPLYLPRYTVRLMIILAFLVTAVYLHKQGQLWQPQVLSVLGMVGAYLLGVVGRWAFGWIVAGNEQSLLATTIADFKAFAVLTVLGLTAAAYLIDQPQLLPPFLQQATLGLTLFYFGSR